jgi:predicted permease
MNDLRYAIRGLRNSPGFTAVVTILLALGIGANCVIFSALDAVMLKKLAARDPRQLFRVITNLPQLGKRSYMSSKFYHALRERSTLISDAFGEIEDFAALTEPGPAEQIRVRQVTPNFFSSLGVNAAYGRVLTADDVNAAVISYRLFERKFSGDAIGRSIVAKGHRYSIVGVLPKNFNGISMDTGPEVRVPLSSIPEHDASEKAALELSIRLRPGVSAPQAAAEVNSIRKAVEPENDDLVELEPLEHGISRFRERFSNALLFLVGTVAVLLLIVCANVAGLLLARSAGRRQEIAVRLALGATRARLIRQTLTESLLLAALGGAGGLAIAFAATPLLQRAIPPQRDFSAEVTPMALDLHLDWRVLTFSVALCVAVAILFGLAPAWQSSRAGLHDALRCARGSVGWRGRQALMIFEVALCTVLLAGAGLLIRTFERLDHMDAGFDRDHVVTFTVNPELAGYSPQQIESLQREWTERVRAFPGVRSVAIAGIGLMRGSGIKTTLGVEGQRITTADFMNTSMNVVSPDYFDTVGIRLIAGRGFRPEDASRKPAAIIVNEAFARRLFPGQDPIGKLVGSGARQEIVKGTSEVVGIVSDAKYRSLREPVPPTRYGLARNLNGRFILHVRTANRPDSIIGPVRESLRALDPALPIIETHTLAEEVSDSLWSERLVATLASAFGALAAILTAVGLYGLLAYAVAQRTREIGIRMALGARVADISRTIGGQALVMIAIGLFLGLGAALLASPAIRSLLYETPPRDALSLSFTAVFILIVGAAATAIPIARAMGIDPAIALRQE